MPEESREGRQRFGVVRGTSALVSVPSSRAFKFHRMSWQEECDTDVVLRETEDFKTKNPGYFKCTGRDWSGEFDYVTGGGASFK